jgi:indole-3-glycerol phosphate synthase
LTPTVPDILARIVSRKREEVLEAGLPVSDLRKCAETARAGRRDFAGALKAHSPAIISEIKKASPSKGVLIADFHAADLAADYARGGAAALSVLTDHDFFAGSLDDLRTARASCALPVLRKDFTISEYQIYEAAAAGADAILLIAAILGKSELKSFRELAESLGMSALVEAHDARELELAASSGASLIGINNRDLRTFRVSLDISIGLASSIPVGSIKVSESGILCGEDIRRLTEAGFDAFLVGEHLVRSGDPAQALRELAS